MNLANAASRGDLTEVNRLVELGADIHANNDTALRSAAENNYFNVVNRLVELGANTNVLTIEQKIQFNISVKVDCIFYEHGDCISCWFEADMLTSCKHYICILCIKQWGTTSCPMCRQPYTYSMLFPFTYI